MDMGGGSGERESCIFCVFYSWKSSVKSRLKLTEFQSNPVQSNSGNDTPQVNELYITAIYKNVSSEVVVDGMDRPGHTRQGKLPVNGSCLHVPH